MRVRLVKAEDVAALANAAEGVFDKPVRPRLLGEFLSDERHHLALAFDDTGLIVGMASAVHYINPDKAPQLFINEVGVSPPFRGRGLGRRLVAELLIVARSKGCTEAWVLTDEENAPARAMYTAAGGKCAARPQLMFSFSLGGT